MESGYSFLNSMETMGVMFWLPGAYAPGIHLNVLHGAGVLGRVLKYSHGAMVNVPAKVSIFSEDLLLSPFFSFLFAYVLTVIFFPIRFNFTSLFFSFVLGGGGCG